MALHKSTIKSQFSKQFKDEIKKDKIEIRSIELQGFGTFVIRVKKELARSTKFGFLQGRTDFDKSDNGVDLDTKIHWS